MFSCAVATSKIPVEEPFTQVLAQPSFKDKIPLFLRPAPPVLFHQTTTVRIITVISLAVCSAASLVKAGSILSHDAPILVTITSLFLTTLGLTTAYAAVALAKRIPHLNDPQYRASLIQQFYSSWPHISGKDMQGKYASILDPIQHHGLLNAQLLAMQQQGESATQAQLFDEFLQWHSLRTLGAVLIQNAKTSQEITLLPGGIENTGSSESSYQGGPPPRLAPTLCSEGTYTPHLPTWSDWIQFLITHPDEDKAQQWLHTLLIYYETQVFQYLSTEERKNLIARIRTWMSPQAPSEGSFTAGMLHVRLAHLKPSSYFHWERDIYAFVLAKKVALEGIQVFEEAFSIGDFKAKRKFARAVSALCPDDGARYEWAMQIREKLLGPLHKKEFFFLYAFASISELWAAALMPCIKQRLVEYQQYLPFETTQKSIRQMQRKAHRVFELLTPFLNPQDAELLRQFQHLSPWDESYLEAREAFLSSPAPVVQITLEPRQTASG